MELNREQIVKALECCYTQGKDCLSCPYENDHSNCIYLEKNALSLIKELTEENERLRAENEALAISEVKECEISQMLVYRIRNKHPAVMAVIADTVRKMQDRLMECFNNEVEHLAMYTEAQVIFAIDQIAKEMIGEKND